MTKTAPIPSLRVSPELRKASESVLLEGETLSSFVEQSLRAHVERRQSQQAFIERGLAARDDAQHTGRYFSAKDILNDMDEMAATRRAMTGE